MVYFIILLFEYYPWSIRKQRTDEHFSQSRKKNKIKKKVKWMLFVKHKLVNTFFDISSKQMKSLFWALVHFYFCYSINLFDGFVLSKVAQEIVKKKKKEDEKHVLTGHSDIHTLSIIFSIFISKDTVILLTSKDEERGDGSHDVRDAEKGKFYWFK